MSKNTRRQFLRNVGAAAGALTLPMIVPASALGRNGFVAPSDRVTLGFIGAGNQAENDARGFLRDERVQITVVCDVNRRSKGYWNGKLGGREYVANQVNTAYRDRYGRSYEACDQYEDFREVIHRADLDAVEIVTPDHWHAIPVMMAAAAGKDIYCQKPLALTVQEGRDMSNAVHKHGVIFQTGSQQRSNHRFRHICELVQNGRIGDLKRVTCGLPGGTPDFGKTGHLTDALPVPRGFNYDMWLGPAPEAPYSPARTHVNFRWILDYSGGMVTDWGGHHPDIAQWGMGMDESGPVKIQNARGKWSTHPLWNTATEFYFECVYGNGVTLAVSSEARHGVTFEGSEGSVWASRGAMDSNPADLIKSTLGEGEKRLYLSEDHYRNFIDCVLDRRQPVAPVEAAHRSITLAHLGNIAMMLGEDLDWDPAQEQFVNHEAANAMLSRPMRAPWDQVYQDHVVG